MAALCELNHVQVTPHHDCFIHAQLVASTPAGGFVEPLPTRSVIRCRRNCLKIRPRLPMAG